MKTKRHLIAIDLDGTLLTDQKTISTKSKQVIKKAVDAGHIVVIATGRPHYASLNYYHDLELDTPMINFNGAYLHHPRDSKWDVLHSPLPIRTAREIIQTCYDVGVINIMADMHDRILLDQHSQEFIDLFDISVENAPLEIGTLNDLLNEDPTSLIIHPYDYQVEELKKSFDRDHAAVIEHRNWGPPWHVIEVIRKGMNKGVAIERLAKYYHIEQSQVIAFGDEDNDIEMIEFAGVSVAMENAIAPLKKIANYQTSTNEADGVATFIADYLKIS